MHVTKHLPLFDYRCCVDFGNKNCKRRTQNKQCINTSREMCTKDGRHAAGRTASVTNSLGRENRMTSGLPARLLIRSDEGLTLETSAFESLYGGQFTLSTQLIKPNYRVILPTDAAPQFR